jgi:hypothetical protein
MKLGVGKYRKCVLNMKKNVFMIDSQFLIAGME